MPRAPAKVLKFEGEPSRLAADEWPLVGDWLDLGRGGLGFEG